MNLTCYLIDEDVHAIELLKRYITATNELELIGIAHDTDIALNDFMHYKIMPDIVFLNISMRDSQNLVFQMGNTTNIVIVSIDERYGPYAYEIGALDYIVKPLEYKRFLKSIERAKAVKKQPLIPRPFIFIPGDKKGLKIKVLKSEIRYIKASANYVKIVTEQKQYLAYLSLGDILCLLADPLFIRVHKSYIINVQKINILDTFSIFMECGVTIPIGSMYKNHLLRTIGGSGY